MADFHLDTNKIKKRLGLDENGRVQSVVDSTVIYYLRLLMPVDTYTMSSNTRNIRPGLIAIETPYAHYQNTGELYVNPMHNAPGFPIYENGTLIGYKGYKGKRVPSGKKMDYSKYGGTERGPDFVDRTLNGHFDDILNAAKNEVKRK